MKKILVISSSLRRNSNSDALAEAFAKGAAEAGNEVETITLKGKINTYNQKAAKAQYLRK